MAPDVRNKTKKCILIFSEKKNAEKLPLFEHLFGVISEDSDTTLLRFKINTNLCLFYGISNLYLDLLNKKTNHNIMTTTNEKL